MNSLGVIYSRWQDNRWDYLSRRAVSNIIARISILFSRLAGRIWNHKLLRRWDRQRSKDELQLSGRLRTDSWKYGGYHRSQSRTGFTDWSSWSCAVPIIDSTCGVFMEMDENRLIAEGFTKQEIAAAIVRGTAASYYYKFVGSSGMALKNVQPRAARRWVKHFLQPLPR